MSADRDISRSKLVFVFVIVTKRRITGIRLTSIARHLIVRTKIARILGDTKVSMFGSQKPIRQFAKCSDVSVTWTESLAHRVGLFLVSWSFRKAKSLSTYGPIAANWFCSSVGRKSRVSFSI